MRRICHRSAWAALALAAVVSAPAGAQTTVSGPIAFGTGLSVSGAGAVSVATGQSGLTCSACTLSGTTVLPGGGEIASSGTVAVGVNAAGGSGLNYAAPLVVDSANNPLGAGNGSIIVQGDSNKERIDLYSAGSAPGPSFQGKGFGGTVASPTATTAGMSLFTLNGGGYTGSAFFGAAAQIKMQADDNWSSTDTGGNITFTTVKDGTTTAVQRLFIANNGEIGVGTTSPNYLLDVEGGQVNASGGFVAAGTAGVSCSGTPTTSFAVTNGIVTHC